MIQDKNEKDSRYPNRFKITNPANGQVAEISAKSVEQMNEWIKAINAVSHNILYTVYIYVHTVAIYQLLIYMYIYVRTY